MSEELTARRVRETREYLALSVKDAAARSATEEALLRRIERGEQPLDELTAVRLARTFGCTPAYLREDPPQATAVGVLGRLAETLTPADRQAAIRFATYLRFATDD